MATWVAVLISGLALIITCAGLIRNDGRRAGKIDKALEVLAELVSDHETRLRGLEAEHPHRRRPAHPGRHAGLYKSAPTFSHHD